jgi:hypothetical protein
MPIANTVNLLVIFTLLPPALANATTGCAPP